MEDGLAMLAGRDQTSAVSYLFLDNQDPFSVMDIELVYIANTWNKLSLLLVSFGDNRAIATHLLARTTVNHLIGLF